MQRLVDIQYQRNNVSRARGTFRVQGDTLEVFPPYETDRLPDRVVGRHGREDLAVRPAHGRADQGRHRRPHDLPGLALRRRREDRMKRALVDDRGGAARAAREARGRGQAPRGRAAADAHELRPRDDARGRVLQRHRELLAPPRRARGRERAVHAARLLPRRLPRRARRIARDGAASSTGCTRATSRASPTLVEYGFRLPSAIDNRPLRFDEFNERVHQLVFMSATPGPVRATRLRSDRRADRPARPASSTPRSRSGRRRARSTT